MKKIIVAGAGHGGLSAAAMLAEKGFDVTVFEKNEKRDLGYDWTDIFDKRALIRAEIPMPERDKYTVKGRVCFYSPDGKAKFIQPSPKNQPQIKMERKDIYALLVSKAEKCGVKFEYGCKVNSPVTEGKRVVGIDTDKGVFFGDLVIDACGCDSPVRKNLPSGLAVQKEAGKLEKFYVFRAFFNNPESRKSDEDFALTLFPRGIPGISWIMSEESFTDVLIGRFEDFSYGEALDAVNHMRKNNPLIGNDVVRAGSFAVIPVRQPLGKMVCDGYAAIGDSAFMTVPLIGSGIANALFASEILAKTVINDFSGDFTAETLWRYQYEYFSKIAVKSAPLACFKSLLAGLDPNTLDRVFRTGNDRFFRGLTDALGKNFDFLKFAARACGIFKNAVADKELSKKLASCVKSIIRLFVLIEKMPRSYNENDVILWEQKYNEIFGIN